MKNIYVIGPQSTGKTTLVDALEKKYKSNGSSTPSIIREVARTVLHEQGYCRRDITSSPIRALQLQKQILKAQYEAERTKWHTDATTWYICDRSGLDPIVYTRCYVGLKEADELLKSQVWRDLEARMRQGVVIVCEAGCKWLVDDGIRLMPTDLEEWAWVENTFRELLEMRCIPYTVLPREVVDIEDRVEHVQQLVAKLCP